MEFTSSSNFASNGCDNHGSALRSFDFIMILIVESTDRPGNLLRAMIVSNSKLFAKIAEDPSDLKAVRFDDLSVTN